MIRILTPTVAAMLLLVGSTRSTAQILPGQSAPAPAFGAVHPDIETSLSGVSVATAKEYAEIYKEAVTAAGSLKGVFRLRVWMAKCLRYMRDPAKAHVELNMAAYLLEQENARVEDPTSVESMWKRNIAESKHRIQAVNARRIADDAVLERVRLLERIARRTEEAANNLRGRFWR